MTLSLHAQVVERRLFGLDSSGSRPEALASGPDHGDASKAKPVNVGVGVAELDARPVPLVTAVAAVPGVIHVVLTRGASGGIGLGFSRATAEQQSGPFIIKQMVPGSVVERSQQIVLGDMLEAVDNISVRDKSVEQVREIILGAPGSSVTLSITRKPPPAESGAASSPASPSSAVPKEQEWVGKDSNRGTEFDKTIEALLARVQGSLQLYSLSALSSLHVRFWWHAFV